MKRQLGKGKVGVAVSAALLGAALGASFGADRAAGAVYWVSNESFGPGTIGRVNLDGTGFDPDFIGGANNPCGVAIDGGHIYWTNRGGPNSIGRAALDGTGVDQTFIDGGLAFPCGPSVNSQYVYWANSLGAGGDGSIGRANLDGTGVSADNVSGGTVSSPLATAMDADFVYWTNSDINGTPPVEPSIYRQEIDAGPPEVVLSGLSPFLTPQWPDLTPSRLFFSGSASGVGSTDREGNDGDTVTGSNAAGGIAVLGSKIYWLSRPDGNLSRANLDGGSPEFTLISGLENPLGLAIDNSHFPPFEFGALRRKKRRGTATLEVILPEPGTLVLAGRGVKRRSLDAPEGVVKLLIRPKRRVRRKLDAKGAAKVRAKITHTPDGGKPATQAKPIRLIKRP